MSDNNGDLLIALDGECRVIWTPIRTQHIELKKERKKDDLQGLACSPKSSKKHVYVNYQTTTIQ